MISYQICHFPIYSKYFELNYFLTDKVEREKVLTYRKICILILSIVFFQICENSLANDKIPSSRVINFPEAHSSTYLSNYQQIIQNIFDELKQTPKSKPYTFIFPDGNSYLVTKALGSGGYNIVFKVQNTLTKNVTALRMPLHPGAVHMFSDFFEYHGNFIEAKIRVPKIHNHQARFYTEVELLDMPFTLDDLLRNSNKYPSGLVEQSIKNFPEFAKLFRNYRGFADGRPENIAYNNITNKWYAVDWAGGPTIRKRVSYNSISGYLNAKIKIISLEAMPMYRGSYDLNNRGRHFDLIFDSIQSNSLFHVEQEKMKLYSKMPINLRQESFSKQLGYVEKLDLDSKKNLSILNELFLKAETRNDLQKISVLSRGRSSDFSNLANDILTLIHTKEKMEFSREKYTFNMDPDRKTDLKIKRESIRLKKQAISNGGKTVRFIVKIFDEKSIYKSIETVIKHLSKLEFKHRAGDYLGLISLIESTPKHLHNELLTETFKSANLSNYLNKANKKTIRTIISRITTLNITDSELRTIINSDQQTILNKMLEKRKLYKSCSNIFIHL